MNAKKQVILNKILDNKINRGDSADLKRMAELSDLLNVEIVSYGLAPNPFGYSLSGEDVKRVPESQKHLLEELIYLAETAPRGYF